MPKQLVVFIYSFLLVCRASYAQQSIADTAVTGTEAVAGAIQVFHRSAGQQSQLYNGRAHIPYQPSMLGSAYYVSNDPQAGAVEYDNILFRNVSLRYDEVRDKVVVQHFNTISAFELFSDRVSRFWVGPHPFVRLVQPDNDTAHTPTTGFYEILSTGKITLLARRKKLIIEFIENMEVKKRIELKESFFARVDGRYYPVNSQNALLDVMQDRKREVQQFMKKNSAKFRKGPENYLVKATDYYNNQPIR
ncbi:MAG: hypothetical protein INR73_08740 [Williamsia sp.]|nr:hypothetical protein [Williamsia sp.]